jgi:hypothetical protein
MINARDIAGIIKSTLFIRVPPFHYQDFCHITVKTLWRNSVINVDFAKTSGHGTPLEDSIVS